MTDPHGVDAGGLSRKRRLLVLAICSMSLLIVGLDTTIVNVALPAIHRSLHASLSGLQWTIDAYTLVLASLLMLSGSTADRIGRRRVFQLGLVAVHARLGAVRRSRRRSSCWSPRASFRRSAARCSIRSRCRSSATYSTTRASAPMRSACGAAMFGISLALGPVLGGVAGRHGRLALRVPRQRPGRACSRSC